MILLDSETIIQLSNVLFYVLLAVGVLVCFLLVIAEWRILQKAGERGWKAIIPIYDLYMSHKISGMGRVWCFVEIIMYTAACVLLMIEGIPDWLDMILVTIFGVTGAAIEICHLYKLGRAFDKGIGFRLGMILLPYVFIPMLAFGGSQYYGTDYQKEKPVPTMKDLGVIARRLENDLMILGEGIVLISAWTFLKFVITLIAFRNVKITPDVDLLYLVMLGVLGIILVGIFLLYSFVGLSARSESRGKRKRPIYLILAGILTVTRTLVILSEIVSFFFTRSGVLTIIISLVIDMTSLVFMLEIMGAAVRLRKLRKKYHLKQGGSYES